MRVFHGGLLDLVGHRARHRTDGSAKRRVADLRRRSREHALLAARPDQREQLQQARDRLALQDRQPRPAAGIQFRGDAADGQRRRSTRPLARAAPWWRSMPPPASCCGCTARTKARAGPTRRASSPAADLSYWTDGREERILYVTPGYRLIALNAKTGAPVPSFGKNGVVDLKLDDDQEIDLVTGEVGLHATPVVAKDIVIVGAAHRPGGVPKSKTNVKGYVRGFDVRTGKRLWIFHTIPKPGEFGYDTWENDSGRYTGNTGVWGQISVDEELGHGVSAGGAADGRLLRRPSARQRPVRRDASSRSI